MPSTKSDRILMADSISDNAAGIWRRGATNHWQGTEPAGGNVLHAGGDVRWFAWSEQSRNVLVEIMHGGTNMYYYAK